MEILAQFIENSDWSKWTKIDTTQNQSFFEHPLFLEQVQKNPVRVLLGGDFEKPKVALYFIYEGHLYEVKKSMTGYFSKATPVQDPKLRPIAINEQEFKDKYVKMLDSARDYLAPHILTHKAINEELIRPADESEPMVLAHAETTEQKKKKWWKGLYEKYLEDVKMRLSGIVSQQLTRKEQIIVLIKFLSQHYQFIQGTCLDYVATPKHPVTIFLMQLAQTIAADLGEKPIDILMPGVMKESLKDGYFNLEEIPLSEVLCTHIALSEHSEFLMHVAQLKAVITEPGRLYSPYAGENAIPVEASQSDIAALFQHSATTRAVHDASMTLESLQSDKSHLLGQSTLLGKKLKFYDAHGGIGTQASAGGGAYQAIMEFMEYYTSLEPCELILKDSKPDISDIKSGHHIAYVLFNDQLYFLNRHQGTVQEIKLDFVKFSIALVSFPNLAQEPDDIQKPCIVKVNDTYTFYSNGRQECKLDSSQINCIATYFHQTSGHVITLSESNIPESVFNAVLSTGYRAQPLVEGFKAKFKSNQTLSKADLAFISLHTGHSFMSGYNIPEPLKNEYELLWQLIHNPAKNIEATENFATCIGTRGEQIRELTTEYADELILIGPNPEGNQQRLADAKERLEALLLDFDAQLAKGEYEGFDGHLKVNAAIMARYKQMIQIESIADLEQLQIFQAEHLKTLLAEKVIPIPQFTGDNFEEFQFYLVHTPAQIFDVVLPYTINILNDNLRHLDFIFEISGPEKKAILIKHLVNNVGLGNVLKVLTAIQRSVLLEEIKNELHSIITNNTQLHSVISVLSYAQCTVVLETISTQLPGMINNALDLKHLLMNLTPEQRMAVLAAMLTWLPGMIKNVEELTYLLSNLSAEQRMVVLVAISKQLRRIITNGEELIEVYNSLSIEQWELVSEAMKEDIPQIIINNLTLFYDSMTNLFKGRRKRFFTKIKFVPDMIQTSSNFHTLLKYLETDQRTAVYEAVKECLPDMIQKATDFNNVLAYLNPDQCTAVYEAVKERLLDMIQEASDFNNVVAYLNSNQRTAVYEAVKECLPDMIQTSMNLYTVLGYLSTQQCDEVYERVKERLPDMIQKASDLRYTLKELTKKQREEIYKHVIARLPLIIKTSYELRTLLEMINEEDRDKTLKALEGYLPKIINHFIFPKEVLKHLSKAQCAIIFKSFEPKLSFDNFLDMFEDLNPLQQEAAIEFYLDAIIEDDNRKLKSLLYRLTNEECRAVCKHLQPRLAKIIINDDCFWYTFGYFDDEKFKSICESFKMALSKFSLNPKSLHKPTPEQKEIFLKALTQARLEKYTARIESHLTPEGETDFRYGTWFGLFRENHNRRSSYNFAKELLLNIPSYASLEVLKQRISDYLAENTVDSAELNEIFKDLELN